VVVMVVVPLVVGWQAWPAGLKESRAHLRGGRG
jgi:hypothetical protein